MNDQTNHTLPRHRTRPQRDEAEIAEAIVGYLEEHPQAMDTLEGIAEWWLTLNQVKFEVQAVGRAVRRLTEQGILEEIGDGRHQRYCLKGRGPSG